MNLKQRKFFSKIRDSNVWWLWEETHILKFVGSNPSTVSWMDIFSQLFVLKIVMFASKDENKRKTGREWPIFKIDGDEDSYLPDWQTNLFFLHALYQ